jgi:hypothetical protein
MVPLSDLRLMQVKGQLGVLGDQIMAELQFGQAFRSLLEGCGEMPLHPPSVAGAKVRFAGKLKRCCLCRFHLRMRCAC